jgi:hypothetical protein
VSDTYQADDDLEGKYIPFGAIAAQDQYGEPAARITVRPPFRGDYVPEGFAMGSVAAQPDPLLRQQVPGEGAGPAVWDIAKQAPEALGIPDAMRALRGQMTENEARDFAFTAALGALPGARAAKGARAVMGSIAEGAAPAARALASPETINRAAKESARGITQPQLRTLYGELGMTGGAPSEFVQPSLGARLPQDVVDNAIKLKLEDRAMLHTLTPAQLATYRLKQKMPTGMMLPSQEVALPAERAFAGTKKEVTRAEKAFDLGNGMAGNRRDLFDLSPQTLMKTPDVPQFNLPRVAPEQTARLEPVSRGGLQRIERAAANAPQENWGWYNLMQARDMFHSIHGSERGEQAFQAWLDGVAGTSMVNPIDNNVRSSTWYLQQLLRGNPLPQVSKIKDPLNNQTVLAMAGGPPPGYGAKSQVQHAQRVQEYLTNSYDPVGNPKPISYRMNLGGNWLPRTVDTHDIRNMVGMPYGKSKVFGENAALLPKEYSYLESVGQRAADRAGTSQAPQQAATWVGGGDYTKLKSFPAPLMEVINRRAHVTGMVRGISAEQALHEAFTGKRPLLSIGGAAAVGAPYAMGETASGDYGSDGL